MIYGLTGLIGSGKGTVCRIFEEHGYIVLSLSDVLRDYLIQRGMQVTRDNLTNIAKELRDRHGKGVLAVKLIEKMDREKDYVIDSFRHPQEVKIFRQFYPDFKLIEVKVDIMERLNRIIKRNRENDPKTLDELQEQERKENLERNQELNNTITMADLIIENNKNLNELHVVVERLIEDE